MNFNYRPEIDGLRAIAVIAVIFYHAQISIFGYQIFKGGFIGVDIFFVISGYLITSIIFKELTTTGSFSFKNFYERRIRRILPVLLIVMLISFPFLWKYVLPENFVEYSKSIIYSLAFNSNFYFWQSGQLYSAESGLLKPFLHTWSLSVEEQFYILFPIVLLTVFKYFRNYLIHLLILGFIISLGLAELGSRNYPSFNFYVLPTRAWELLAGSILAYFETINDQKCKIKFFNFILPSIGFFLIGFSLLFFNDKTAHPSFYSLIPIMGVSLIIWFSNKDEIVTKILSTKIFIGIGLISYSLYVWHYPIFAITRLYFFIEIQYFIKLILIIFIFILSTVSYYIVEKPFRNKKNKVKKIYIFIVIFYIFLFILNFFVIFNDGFKSRFSSYFKGQLVELRSNEILYNLTGQKISNKNIEYKINLNNPSISLLGDSHAEALSYGLWKNLNKNYNINFSVYYYCPFILDVNFVNYLTFETSHCSASLQEKRFKFVNKNKQSIIILFSRLPLVLNEDRFQIQNKTNSLKSIEERQRFIRLSFKKTIQKLLENNHKIVFVYPIPVGEKDVTEILKKEITYGRYSDLIQNKKLFTISSKDFKNRSKKSFELLDDIQNDNIFRIYPHQLFCDTIIKNECLTHYNDNIFYADDDHPSLKGAEKINDLILKEIEKIEKNF